MSEMYSAGTFVGAVLEFEGYLAQARLLDSLADFFNNAGAAVYLFAIIGGLTSVALFGSYRAARYLVIGPLLYWMLIIPRAEIPGVMLQMGGSGEQMYNSKPSSEQVHEITSQLSNGTGGANVAFIFQLYTSIIDQFINEVIDVILQDENGKDLFFLDRLRALDMLTTATISDSRLRDMFKNAMFGVNPQEGSAGPCYQYMNSALFAAAPLRRENDLATFINDFETWKASGAMPGDQADILLKRAAALDGAKEYYKELFEKVSSNSRTEVSDATISFMADNSALPNVSQVLARPEYGLSSGATKDEIRAKVQTMTCNDLWKVIQDGVYQEAATKWDTVFSTFKTKWESRVGQVDQETQQQFCRDLAEKMGRTVQDTATCDIVPLAYLYLMHSAIKDGELSSIVQRQKDRVQFLGVPEGAGDLSVRSAGENEEDWDYGPQAAGTGPSSSDGQSSRYDVSRNADGDVVQVERQRHFKNKRGASSAAAPDGWFADKSVGDMDGSYGAAFDEFLRYDTERLRQQTFTYALELPYWQGTLLYILALSYPFWALLVLMPGKAQTWITLPLAWFWVKSWDAFLAVLVIFDKVAWNLLPSPEAVVVNQIYTPIDKVDTPNILAEAMKADPSYNIHIYYWALSILIMSIPALSAALILKGRKSLLASFTGGMSGFPQRAGDLAAGSYGVGMMNQLLTTARDGTNFERIMASHSGSSGGGGRTGAGDGIAASSAKWAAMAFSARLQRNLGTDLADRVSKSVNMQDLKQMVAKAQRNPIPGAGQKQLVEDLVAGIKKNGGYRGLKSTPEQIAYSVLDAFGQGLQVGWEIRKEEIRYKAESQAMWGPHGRQTPGGAYRQNQATASAMDQEPRFELDDRGASAVDAYARLIGTKNKYSVEIAQDLAIATGQDVRAVFRGLQGAGNAAGLGRRAATAAAAGAQGAMLGSEMADAYESGGGGSGGSSSGGGGTTAGVVENALWKQLEEMYRKQRPVSLQRSDDEATFHVEGQGANPAALWELMEQRKDATFVGTTESFYKSIYEDYESAGTQQSAMKAAEKVLGAANEAASTSSVMTPQSIPVPQTGTASASSGSAPSSGSGSAGGTSPGAAPGAPSSGSSSGGTGP